MDSESVGLGKLKILWKLLCWRVSKYKETWNWNTGGWSSVQSPFASLSLSSELSSTQTASSPTCCRSGRRCFAAGSQRIAAPSRSQQKPWRWIFIFALTRWQRRMLCRITKLQILLRVIFHKFIRGVTCHSRWGRSHGLLIRENLETLWPLLPSFVIP